MFKIREAKPLLDSKKDNLNNETDVNDRLKSIYIKIFGMDLSSSIQ